MHHCDVHRVPKTCKVQQRNCVTIKSADNARKKKFKKQIIREKKPISAVCVTWPKTTRQNCVVRKHATILIKGMYAKSQRKRQIQSTLLFFPFLNYHFFRKKFTNRRPLPIILIKTSVLFSRALYQILKLKISSDTRSNRLISQIQDTRN